MPRILNCGFHALSPDYIEALKQIPPCSDVNFEEVRPRTYMPIMADEITPMEVYNLCRAALLNAKPTAGDVVIISGHADVVLYMSRLLKDTGAVVLCPVGRIRDGKFCLKGFREVVLSAGEDESCLENGRLFISNGDVGRRRHEGGHLREERVQAL